MSEELTTPQIDYSSRDYESIISDLIEKINYYFPDGEWTDHNPSDLGIGLLELFSYVADSLHYYVDRMLNESFLNTAISRASVINLLKLIDYELASASPASVDLKFTLGAVQIVDVTIPEGTQCQSSGSTPIYFETVEDLVITAGNLQGTVGALEGQTQGENLDDSDGTSYQTRDLTPAGIIDGTVKVFIDEGSGEQEWTEVDTLALSLPTDKHFYTQRDAEDKVSLHFGDNGQGKIPASSATIRSSYRVGGGIRGNVGAGIITIVISTIYAGPNPITVSVTNDSAASGGEDEETIDNARIMGPRELRTLNRAVTEEDYETLAEGYAGVAKATLIPEQPRMLRILNLHIAPVGGGIPSQPLKDGLHDYLDEINMVNDVLDIEDPVYVSVDISGDVYVLPNYVQADVEAAVLAALTSFFDLDTGDLEFGTSVHISDLYRLIDELDGVDYVDFTKLTMVPVIYEDTWSGNPTWSAITIGPLAVAETWTIEFTSPTAFKMTGSVSGLQTATGTLGALYTSDSSEISFTLTAGVNPMSTGDTAHFRTSPLIGNVDMLDAEIAKQGTVNLTFHGGA